MSAKLVDTIFFNFTARRKVTEKVEFAGKKLSVWWRRCCFLFLLIGRNAINQIYQSHVADAFRESKYRMIYRRVCNFLSNDIENGFFFNGFFFTPVSVNILLNLQYTTKKSSIF